jgi:hypothetical protein
MSSSSLAETKIQIEFDGKGDLKLAGMSLLLARFKVIFPELSPSLGMKGNSILHHHVSDLVMSVFQAFCEAKRFDLVSPDLHAGPSVVIFAKVSQ